MKLRILASVLSLAFVATGASAFPMSERPPPNGANGLSYNGFSVNGFSVNGFSVNGLSANGLSANGTSSDHVALKAVVLAAGERVVLR